MRSNPISDDEKVTLIMVYSPNNLVRGEVVTKKVVRVSTWLRSPMAPQYLTVHNAQLLLLGGPGQIQSMAVDEYFISANQVVAYHMVPPNQDPMDYDLSEPNRKMEPVTILLGTFRFNGHIRMSDQSVIGKHMDTSREAFMSLYDVEVVNPGIPSMGSIKVPYVQFRPNLVAIASRPPS
jgi:hypothetical protein